MMTSTTSGLVERSFSPMGLTLMPTMSEGETNWSQAERMSFSPLSSSRPFSTAALILDGSSFPPDAAVPVEMRTTWPG
jgi:hypothetical protein